MTLFIVTVVVLFCVFLMVTVALTGTSPKEEETYSKSLDHQIRENNDDDN